MSERLQAASAIRWRAADELVTHGLGLVFGILLARLLRPEDFGLFAMLMVFVALGNVLISAGFGHALIQRKHHTREDECTVFWFNQVAGIALSLALVLGAPLVAALFDQAALTNPARFMAMYLWLSSLLSVPVALLSKQLAFRAQMIAQVIGVLIGGLAGLVLASQGAGVWAIVVQTVLSTLVRVILVWSVSRWWPSLVFSWESFRRLFSFGSYMMLTELLSIFSGHLYALLIGRRFGAADLGIFHRAQHTANIPMSMVAKVFSRVAFPLFSAVNDDRKRLRRRLRTGVVAVMAINLPVMGGVLVTADVFVPLVFGAQWRASVPFLEVFALVSMLWPLHLANTLALQALGHSRLVLRVEAINKTLFIITLVLASRYGMMAMAWAMLALQVGAVVLMTWFTRSLLRYGLLRQLRDILPYVLLTLAMMAAVHGLNTQLTGWDPTVRLLALVGTGVAVYFGLGLLAKAEAMGLVEELLRLRAKHQAEEAGKLEG